MKLLRSFTLSKRGCFSVRISWKTKPTEYTSSLKVFAWFAELIFDTDDPRFVNYRVPQINIPDAVTVAEVVEVARKYILACSDPAALSIDQEYCSQIGGHVHMAKITRVEGFQWVEAPVTTRPP